MKKIAILSATLVLGVMTALALGHFVMPKRQPSKTVQAHWKDIYRKPAGLIAGADLIVMAKHLSADPGRAVGDGEDTTPFTNNTFSVESILKGVHEDSTLQLEQTGGIMADGQLYNINDGGPYEPGATYMLFLKNTGEGGYYLINYQARYRVVDGVLEGVDPTDRVVASMHGAALGASEQMIQKRLKMLE